MVIQLSWNRIQADIILLAANVELWAKLFFEKKELMFLDFLSVLMVYIPINSAIIRHTIYAVFVFDALSAIPFLVISHLSLLYVNSN